MTFVYSSPLKNGCFLRSTDKTDNSQQWSGQQDSNLRPPGPKPGALPDCAMPRQSYRYSEMNRVSSTQKQEYSVHLIYGIKQAKNSTGGEHEVCFGHMDILANPTAHLDKSHAACRAHQPTCPLQPISCARRTQKFRIELHGNRTALQIAEHSSRCQTISKRTQKTSMTNISAIAMTTLQSDTLPEAFTIGPMIPGAVMRGERPAPNAQPKGFGCVNLKINI